jgi:hypothetical protein
VFESNADDAPRRRRDLGVDCQWLFLWSGDRSHRLRVNSCSFGCAPRGVKLGGLNAKGLAISKRPAKGGAAAANWHVPPEDGCGAERARCRAPGRGQWHAATVKRVLKRLAQSGRRFDEFPLIKIKHS